jgi:hypothetical protein
VVSQRLAEPGTRTEMSAPVSTAAIGGRTQAGPAQRPESGPCTPCERHCHVHLDDRRAGGVDHHDLRSVMNWPTLADASGNDEHDLEQGRLGRGHQNHIVDAFDKATSRVKCGSN